MQRMITFMVIVVVFLGCEKAAKQNVPQPQASDKQTAPTNADATAIDTTFDRSVVYRSSDKGESWLSMSGGLPENTQASFFEKKGKEIVLATDNQGLYMTEGNRTHWKNIGQHLSSPKVNALHISGEEMFVGLSKQGIFVSKDNGASWVSLNEGLTDLNVRAIVKYKAKLLAGTDVGIFEKQKNTWRLRFKGAQISSLNLYNGKIVAGTSAGVLLSTDGGQNWKPIHNEGALHSTAVIDGKIFAMYISGNVSMSADWGKTWANAVYAPRKGSYVHDLTKVGNNLIMSNYKGVFRSPDKGTTWKLIYPEERFVFLDFIAFDNIVYGGTRGASEYRNRK